MTRLAHLLALLCAVAASVQAAALTAADRAFIPLLLRADRDLKKFAIVARQPVSDRLDLVLALGTPNPDLTAYDGWYSWLREDRLGIFLQDRGNASRVFTLAIEPGPPCRIHLEQMTGRDVLISCPGEFGWHNSADSQKFVFDIRTKQLVGHYAYPPFADYVLGPGWARTLFGHG